MRSILFASSVALLALGCKADVTVGSNAIGDASKPDGETHDDSGGGTTASKTGTSTSTSTTSTSATSTATATATTTEATTATSTATQTGTGTDVTPSDDGDGGGGSGDGGGGGSGDGGGGGSGDGGGGGSGDGGGMGGGGGGAGAGADDGLLADEDEDEEITVGTFGISNVTNKATYRDQAKVVEFTLTSPMALTCSAAHLSATSSHASVVSPADITFGGAYPDCTATLTPVNGATGTTAITITVTNGADQASDSFSLIVTPPATHTGDFLGCEAYDPTSSAFEIYCPLVPTSDPTPTIKWYAHPSATGYTLAVSPNADCSAPTQEHVLPAGTLQKTVDPLGVGTHYFCLKAQTTMGDVAAPALDLPIKTPGTWSAMTTTGAPSARRSYGSTFTGRKIVIWGGVANANGLGGTSYRFGGGIYDPKANSWLGTNQTVYPNPRRNATLVWTGKKVIIFGGYGLNGVETDGRSLDVDTGDFTPISTVGQPTARYLHTAVWTGSRMLVWGGLGGSGAANARNTGGAYDPDADQWTPINTTGAPSARSGHSALWTGRYMIIWGGTGTDGAARNDGALYDPATDSWTPITSTNVPIARVNHTTVWDGTRMIVFGGSSDASTSPASKYKDGAYYTPPDHGTEAWVAMAEPGYMDPRRFHGAGVANGKMVTQGGFTTAATSGWGVFDLATNDWDSVTGITGMPTARQLHTGISTGGGVAFWGGAVNAITHRNDGAIFYP